MEEEEVRRARIEEALSRCLVDSGLSGGAGSASLVDRRNWIRRGADRLIRLGASATLPGDADFPPLLVGIPDEPAHLFYRGTLPAPGDFTVAIVGTRIPTPSGQRFAAESATLLANAGATIVSGLARGIDGIAHRHALDAPAGGAVPTVAVLACGLDLCYPSEHGRLFDQIASRGALVSEFPPGAPPLRHNFIRRNRLLSGMSRLVVVVEARSRSGALVTAQYGADQGREVAAVPGDIFSPPSAGPNQLISDGATPIVSMESLIAACERLGLRRRRVRRPEPLSLGLELDTLCGDLSRLVDRLGPRPRSADALAAELDWPAVKVLGALLELELRECVRRHAAGYVRVK